MYQRLTSELVQKLKAIVGSAGVLEKKDDMEAYAHDYTEDLRYFPEIVVRADTTE